MAVLLLKGFVKMQSVITVNYYCWANWNSKLCCQIKSCVIGFLVIKAFYYLSPVEQLFLWQTRIYTSILMREIDLLLSNF